jgi:sugar/nucleoside kinase (ribokinase family)
MFAAAGSNAEGFCQWARALGEPATVLGEALPPGLRLLLLDARDLFRPESGRALKQVFDSARSQRALIALDLGPPAWIRERGGPRTAYQLATLQADIIFSSAESSAEVGAPLEGITSVPVVTMGAEGCSVYGHRLVAPEGTDQNAVGFMAAFCVALVAGLAPVEAAGRAVLVAAGRLVDAAQEAPAG